ncbi:MAG: transcription termination/antitermination protein NusG [Lachnospiraceae bacterium]|nr:transcription termination/antitermination protein NusG [Lachnospiraceae bacterium]
MAEAEARWYVAHTYSGYENKVKADLEKTIENRHLEELIQDVRVPVKTEIEIKPDGSRKTVEKKLFPGYVLVNMIMTNDTWYVVRNTRGVTGFVGPDGKPVPLSENEMSNLGIASTTEEVKVDFEEGDTVVVTVGVWKDTEGVVKSMNYAKLSATVMVNILGSEVPVENIPFLELRKVVQ